jgi:hypothetical protein
MEIIVKKTKIPINETALEEIEGRFMECFGELPDAYQSMTLYAIEYGQCPMCGFKPAERIRSKERDMNIAVHVDECFKQPE